MRIADDEAFGHEQPALQLGGYGDILMHRAMPDREGVKGPGDVWVVRDRRRSPRNWRGRRRSVPPTFVGIPSGNDGDRRRALEHLAPLNGSN
jgi:hypothetical protein